MTATTFTLTDFLLARIAEDEGGAILGRQFGGFQAAICARVLAECEAKRRILALHSGDGWDCPTCADEEVMDEDSEGNGSWHRSAETYPCPTLRALAAVYADHPDHRGEWKP